MKTTFYVPDNDDLEQLVDSMNQLTQTAVHRRSVVCMWTENPELAALLTHILRVSGLEYDFVQEESGPAAAAVDSSGP